MILEATTKSIEVILAGAVAANQLPIVATYADHTATAFTPGASDTQTNNTTAVTAVAAPAAATQRQVKFLSVYNADTANATPTIRLNNAATLRTLVKSTLQPGEALHYRPDTGFYVIDQEGYIKSGGSVVRVPLLVKSPIVDAANLTTVTAFASGTCHVYYVGVCPHVAAQVRVQNNITTGAATITWAEVAIYKGTPVIGAGPTNLVRLGSLNVAGTWNGTGRKTTTIALNPSAQPGDHIFLVMGASATTPFQMRGALADDIQSGMFATLAAQPSATAGPTTGTLAGATVVPAWFAVQFN